MAADFRTILQLRQDAVRQLFAQLPRCERLSWGRGYALYLEELPVPISQSLESAVEQINAAMEAAIRQCPQQYLWGYGRYKQPRVEREGEKA